MFNAYDGCVANKDIDGLQQTIRFHVDDIMSSHKDPKVNDAFHVWLNEQYGEIGEVKSTRGKIHEYLGMTLDFSTPGELVVDMSDYIGRMIEDFSIELTKKDVAKTPAAPDFFDASKGDTLEEEMKPNITSSSTV